MAAWEAEILPHITQLRTRHLQALTQLGRLSICVALFSLTLPTICIFAAVLTAYIGEFRLNASFMATVALFAQLRSFLLVFGPSLRMRAGAIVSVEKIQDFLCIPAPSAIASSCCVIREAAVETSAVSRLGSPLQRLSSRRSMRRLPPTSASPSRRPGHGASSTEVVITLDNSASPPSTGAAATLWRERVAGNRVMPSPDVLVEAAGATCTWFARKASPIKSSKGSPLAFALRDLSFSVRRGSVLGLTGSSGSGKTAVMNMLLGDMQHLSGAMLVRGRVAFTSQAVWLEPGSVRDNILFGLPMRKEWYDTVLRVRKFGSLPALAVFMRCPFRCVSAGLLA